MFRVKIEHNKKKEQLEKLREARRALVKELEESKDFVRIGTLKMAITELEGEILAAEAALKDKRSLREHLDKDKEDLEAKRTKVSEVVQEKTLQFEITISELVKEFVEDLEEITGKIVEESGKFESTAAIHADKDIRWRTKVFKPVTGTVRELEGLNKELLYKFSFR